MNNEKSGIIYGVVAYLIWGVLPLYWKLMESVPAEEILAHRVFWSLIFMIFVILFNRQLHELIDYLKNAMKQTKQLMALAIAAALISVNWFIYIWAVNHEQVVEASLGYYINPLVSVLLGIIFLKERLNVWQMLSFALAAIGVVILTVQHGNFPWIAITLAVTFGLYGLAKKLIKVDSSIGLTFETAIVSPIAFIYIAFLEFKGTGSFSIFTLDSLLFTGAGPATALPLLLFAKGAQRIPLTMMGFLQYIAPTISLLLGIFIFGELFTNTHLLTFGLIWTSLIIFSFSRTKRMESIEQKLFNKKTFQA